MRRWVAWEPEAYIGEKVPNGHCVAFVRKVTGIGPTSTWRRGEKVRDSDAEPGTAIATFGPDGRYQNLTDGTSHAAILFEQTNGGLAVFDQWLGHPVARRVIQFRGGSGKPPSDDGDAFSIVLTDDPDQQQE